jgi:hypothetical protein
VKTINGLLQNQPAMAAEGSSLMGTANKKAGARPAWYRF